MAVSVVLISGDCLLAQEWPQWRGVNRDGKVSGFSAPPIWPTNLTRRWQVTVGKGDASPVLAGEKHYVFGRQEADEVVLCLNPASGKSIWEAKYPAGRVVGGPAVRHPVLIGACQTRSSVHSLGTAVQQNEAADQSAGWH